ncbi:MAG TPA: DUF1549 and DUF1553 domain-containing protein [Verrucomicrobiae bacterium]|nr:DUF1549 and DUF1553 domain-containing protein [Verrucomicrobiae bacterium]
MKNRLVASPARAGFTKIRDAWACVRLLVLAGGAAWVFAAVAADQAPSQEVPKPVAVYFENQPGTQPGTTNQIPIVGLRGSDARHQVLLSAKYSDGTTRDVTRIAKYEAEPAQVVRVERSGRLVPLADGKAVIRARLENGPETALQVAVEHFGDPRPINFANQVVPIFTKAGCNGGGCHGKSAGQNGFRLSLLGFEPTEDYEHLVKEARGRRLFPGAPERSLLLLKGVASVPHGGGKRLDTDSDDYRLLVRWMAQGMPYGKPNDPSVERIEVIPRQRTMALGGEQQLVVLAHYTDGWIEDVTQGALYEPNDKDMARADETGLIKLYNQPGDVAVMVRYQAKVATFRATIPLGAPIESLPPARNFVDTHVFEKLKVVGMPASAVCDDPTFIRRATIDVAGRLPTPEELQRFLADKTADKRDRLIDRLLASRDYADYFANKWSSLFRNKRINEMQAHGTYAFHGWIRDSLAANKPFDQMVREIVAASGDIAQNPPVAWYRQVNNMTSQLEDTAQLLLGQRLQCAQCHHHPYEKWSQQDYYSFGAFFSRVGRKGGSAPGEDVVYHKRGVAEAVNKKNKQTVRPAGLAAKPLNLSEDDDPRLALADWMTNRDNPFFARSLANRYWKHFFNRGLVEPEDDMRETNPPTNPELLDALAAHFIKSGYDLKQLVRAICRSTSYQLSAVPNQFNGIDKQNFSRYYPKRLTAEVLYDAVNAVTGSESKFDGQPAGTRAVCLPDNSYNASTYFLQVFGRPDSSSSCECERSQDASLAQSLHLLNAKDIQEKISAEKGRAAQLAADRSQEDDVKISELYRRAFSREPRTEELQTARNHLTKYSTKSSDDKGNAVNGRRLAFEDMVWALLNTKEFLFNH